MKLDFSSGASVAVNATSATKTTIVNEKAAVDSSQAITALRILATNGRGVAVVDRAALAMARKVMVVTEWKVNRGTRRSAAIAYSGDRGRESPIDTVVATAARRVVTLDRVAQATGARSRKAAATADTAAPQITATVVRAEATSTARTARVITGQAITTSGSPGFGGTYSELREASGPTGPAVGRTTRSTAHRAKARLRTGRGATSAKTTSGPASSAACSVAGPRATNAPMSVCARISPSN